MPNSLVLRSRTLLCLRILAYILLIGTLPSSLCAAQELQPPPPRGNDYVVGPGEIEATLTQLEPGDRMILKNGTYAPFTVTNLHGTASEPIAIMAENERRALVKGDGTRNAVEISNSSYIVVYGLHIENADNPNETGSDGRVLVVSGSDRVTLQRNLCARPNRWGNNAGINLSGGTTNSLVEENELYDFHRNGITCHGETTRNNIIRRNYVNSRGQPHLRTGMTVNDGIVMYRGSDNIIENNIVEYPAGTSLAYGVWGEGNRLLGNIALDAKHGFAVVTAVTKGFGDDVVLRDNLAFRPRDTGFFMNTVKEVALENNTVIGAGGSAFTGGNRRPEKRPDGFVPSFTWQNLLAVHVIGNGFRVETDGLPYSHKRIENSYGWNVQGELWGPGTDFVGRKTDSIDPGLAATPVYLSEDSPLQTAGTDGGPVGATILYRYENGELTAQPLWDPVTGAFPHGAVIEGVNDTPGTSAHNVHERLNVSATTLPSDYSRTTADRHVPATSTSHGNGFVDHGIPVPLSQRRGAAATVDGSGRRIILVFPRDHDGTGSILVIDAETGATEQVPTPDGKHDSSPFAVLHSSQNRLYSHFNESFYEFDAESRSFRFSGELDEPFAMSFTEGPDGRIWAASYPNSHLIEYDPNSRELTDHGPMNDERWRQYPRSLAADTAGWVYLGIGITKGQIVAFHPETGKKEAIVADERRRHGAATVFRGTDGNVYGQAYPDGPWLEFVAGSARRIDAPPVEPVPIRAGTQSAVFQDFPDGSVLADLSTIEKSAEIEESGRTRRISFDYESRGAALMSLIEGPDDILIGSSGLPLAVFTYFPGADSFVYRRLSGGHVNTFARHEDHVFMAVYAGGILYEYDASSPWVAGVNPRQVFRVSPLIHRPHAVLAHPNGRHVVFGGTPHYGLTGGGMVIYDRVSGDTMNVRHEDLSLHQSIRSLAPLPDDRVLVGTTTSPGTGGERIASEAELYIYDMKSKEVVYRNTAVEGVEMIKGLLPDEKGLIFGLAHPTTFFVFDPARREVIHREEVKDFGAVAGHQGQNVLTTGPDGRIYAIFKEAIVRIDPQTFELTKLAEPPVDVDTGLGLIDGRLYFTHGPHLWSFELPRKQ